MATTTTCSGGKALKCSNIMLSMGTITSPPPIPNKPAKKPTPLPNMAQYIINTIKSLIPFVSSYVVESSATASCLIKRLSSPKFIRVYQQPFMQMAL